MSTIAEPALPPLAVTLGDPAGIGPETVVRAWLEREAQRLPPFFAIGTRAALEAVGFDGFAVIGAPDEAAALFDRALPLIELPGTGAVTPGRPDA
ncbi:MAG: 4-hydroxythreonine-4-phosphate dehydrogenase, partial [Sphingomonadaceae bacterium]